MFDGITTAIDCLLMLVSTDGTVLLLLEPEGTAAMDETTTPWTGCADR
jgi:hypothetical protein